MLLVALLMVVFLSGEWYLHRYKPSLVEFDPELGWKLKANFDRTYQQKTLQGQKYQARFQTNEYGFRTYGTNAPDSLKILILGDSFTADAFSSNEEAWFTVLAKEIEHEKRLTSTSVTVWAGGAGGYGTLQEYLLAKRVKPIFNPDILILQFCANDFTDNHLLLESNGFLRQLYFRRPYLNPNGNIELSNHYLAHLYRSFIFQNSRIFNKIDSFINFLEYKYHGNYGKKIDAEIEKQYIRESLKTTQNLLINLANEFPNSEKIAVNCSFSQVSPNSEWNQLASSAGFIPLEKPTEIIDQKLGKDEDLLHSDGGHWNNIGNQVFGSAVYEELKKLNLYILNNIK